MDFDPVNVVHLLAPKIDGEVRCRHDLIRDGGTGSSLGCPDAG